MTQYCNYIEYAYGICNKKISNGYEHFKYIDTSLTVYEGTLRWSGDKRVVLSHSTNNITPINYCDGIQITCNGTPVKPATRHIDSTIYGATNDINNRQSYIEITPYLITGNNTIKVELQSDTKYFHLGYPNAQPVFLKCFNTTKINSSCLLFPPTECIQWEGLYGHFWWPYGNFYDPYRGYRWNTRYTDTINNPVLIYYSGSGSVWLSGSPTTLSDMILNDGIYVTTQYGTLATYQYIGYHPPTPLWAHPLNITSILRPGYTMTWFRMYSGPYAPDGSTASNIWGYSNATNVYLVYQ